jgi:hypothetical protein
MGRRVGRVDVEYSRFGEIFVAGVRFDHDVIVERGGDDAGGRARPGLTGNRFGQTPPSADEEIPSSARRPLIDPGADSGLPVMQEVRDLAEAPGVEVMELSTAEGCPLLRSARRKQVDATLHVIC